MYLCTNIVQFKHYIILFQILYRKTNSSYIIYTLRRQCYFLSPSRITFFVNVPSFEISRDVGGKKEKGKKNRKTGEKEGIAKGTGSCKQKNGHGKTFKFDET